MSNIRANTISDAAGTGPITLTGQEGVKARGSFYHVGGAPTVLNSFNVSSLSDFGTGTTDVNFTNGFSSLFSFSTVVAGWAYSSWVDSDAAVLTASASSSRIVKNEGNGVYVDANGSNQQPLNFLTAGDLA